MKLLKQLRTVICDVEANGLTPDKIHVVVCKDIETNEVFTFYDQDTFGRFADGVGCFIGHNFLGYDLSALASVWNYRIRYDTVVDTLVCSRLFDATRLSHSIETWGAELGRPKAHAGITDWSVFTPEMEERCRSDVEVNHLLYQRFNKFIVSPLWKDALATEHFIAFQNSILRKNGFAFNLKGSKELKVKIDKELEVIDKNLKVSFGLKILKVREVTPKETKFGTIAKNSVPRSFGPDLSPFTAGAPFTVIEYQEFNPKSHKQRLDRLWESGWAPINKTKGHKDTEKAVQTLKRARGYNPTRKSEIAALEASLGEYGVSGHGRYGWMTDEDNLATLPDSAPDSCKTLARFLLLSSRSSTLQSWIDACGEDERIHGSFHGIGAWTHRMSHSNPNMGNIPKFDAKQPHKTPYSDKMRSLWLAGKDRYLVGVDAESIQLRILGHYINDKEFINALVAGTKEAETDPHSLNKRGLGRVCKSRDDAKTFIYAWLLGAGLGKIAAILGCSHDEAREANENFLDFYPGLRYIKEEVIPHDASRGYFQGFDGRFVRIWGDDISSRSHFTLAGYLQCGEAVIMKRAAQLWVPKLEHEKIPFWWVNFVHDEFQIETIRDMEVARYVATTVADSIRQVGEDLKLRCPFAGSILNGHGKVAIGDNWMDTH